MAIKYLAGERLIGTAAERTATSSAAAQSWKELGRTTLGSAGTTISVTVAAKDNIMLLGFLDIAGSSISTVKMTFNSDTGSNYAVRRSANFATDSTLVSQTGIDVGNVLALENFFTANIRNISAEEKLIETDVLEEGAAGAGTAPDTEVAVSKWANTSAQITTITLTGTNNFDTGSELVVLGMDDDEDGSSGTNFWQQLKLFEGAAPPQDTTHGGDEDTGTFTPKKYMMVDIMTTGGNDRFGYGFKTNMTAGGGIEGASSAWSQRRDSNGTASTGTGSNYINLHGTMDNGSTEFVKMLILNHAGKEKLLIWRSAASVGNDRVVGFAKFSGNGSTRPPIDRLGSVYTTGQHSWEMLRVWGSD